jgi:hypothetical protein
LIELSAEVGDGSFEDSFGFAGEEVAVEVPAGLSAGEVEPEVSAEFERA